MSSKQYLFAWFFEEECVESIDPELPLCLSLTGKMVDSLKRTNIKGELVTFDWVSLLHLRTRLQIDYSCTKFIEMEQEV